MDFRIERGVPTDEELAAIVGVLLLRRPAQVSAPAPANQWTASGRPTAGPRPGAGAWRASGLPR